MCAQHEWQECYIEHLVHLLNQVKEVVAEVPEAWVQLERAGINLGLPTATPFDGKAA